MKRTRRNGTAALILLALLFVAGACFLSGPATSGVVRSPVSGTAVASGTVSTIPKEAIETYQFAKANRWRARQGYVGNREFENREGRLPRGGEYREYDIHPTRQGVNRGPERIVIDTRTGKGWYTGTHYGDAGEPAFVEIRE